MKTHTHLVVTTWSERRGHPHSLFPVEWGSGRPESLYNARSADFQLACWVASLHCSPCCVAPGTQANTSAFTYCDHPKEVNTDKNKANRQATLCLLSNLLIERGNQHDSKKKKLNITLLCDLSRDLKYSGSNVNIHKWRSWWALHMQLDEKQNIVDGCLSSHFYCYKG